MDRYNGIYCDHIENKLPKPSKQSVDLKKGYRWFGDEAMDCFKPYRELSIRQLVREFAKNGLTVHEIKLVYYRAFKGRSFKYIVDKQGWVSIKNASYHYKRALEKLRRGGFSIYD